MAQRRLHTHESFKFFPLELADKSKKWVWNISVDGLLCCVYIFYGPQMCLKIVHRICFPEAGHLSLETELYGQCFQEHNVDWFA